MRLDDGFATLIGFDLGPTLKIYEKEVTPPGMSGGGANDTTTMRNTSLRTKAPKKLKTMDNMTATVAYDPEVYDSLFDMVNQNQEITITFPDDSTLVVWGWLDEFKPNAIKEGEQPTAMITVICSNQNDSGVETAPVYSA